MKRVWLGLVVLGGVALGSFSDLPQGPIAEQVAQVVQAGWMQGYPDGTFRGQELINRYQLAAALGRVLKDLGVEGKEVAFKDVPRGHWALEPLGLAVSWGLVSGYPDGTFRGQEPLTRAALAVVLAKLLERLEVDKVAPLPWDVPEGHWAAPAVRRVLGAGLMEPNPDGSFAPGAEVNRYLLARALAALRPWVGAKQAAKTASKTPSAPPALPEKTPSTVASEAKPAATGVALEAQPLGLRARWVGMARGRPLAVGEKVNLLAPEGPKEVAAAGDTEVALPPWVLRAGALEDGKNRYVPLGAGGGKEVLPPAFKGLKEGHLALDLSGNYLLLVNAAPLCDCPSRVVRLLLLLTQPVGVYAEYVYLLDDPENRVAGVAWPDPKNLLVLETGKGSSRLYRVNLNAGEDIAFSAWDEGGLEARNPVPVRPVAKVLLAELPLAALRGLAFEGPDRLLTVVGEEVRRVQLPSALW